MTPSAPMAAGRASGPSASRSSPPRQMQPCRRVLALAPLRLPWWRPLLRPLRLPCPRWSLPTQASPRQLLLPRCPSPAPRCPHSSRLQPWLPLLLLCLPPSNRPPRSRLQPRLPLLPLLCPPPSSQPSSQQPRPPLRSPLPSSRQSSSQRLLLPLPSPVPRPLPSSLWPLPLGLRLPALRLRSRSQPLSSRRLARWRSRPLRPAPPLLPLRRRLCAPLAASCCAASLHSRLQAALLWLNRH